MNFCEGNVNYRGVDYGTVICPSSFGAPARIQLRITATSSALEVAPRWHDIKVILRQGDELHQKGFFRIPGITAWPLLPPLKISSWLEISK